MLSLFAVVYCQLWKSQAGLEAQQVRFRDRPVPSHGHSLRTSRNKGVWEGPDVYAVCSVPIPHSSEAQIREEEQEVWPRLETRPLATVFPLAMELGSGPRLLDLKVGLCPQPSYVKSWPAAHSTDWAKGCGESLEACISRPSD